MRIYFLKTCFSFWLLSIMLALHWLLPNTIPIIDFFGFATFNLTTCFWLPIHVIILSGYTMGVLIRPSSNWVWRQKFLASFSQGEDSDYQHVGSPAGMERRDLNFLRRPREGGLGRGDDTTDYTEIKAKWIAILPWSLDWKGYSGL